jgi:hypothetical protein
MKTTIILLSLLFVSCGSEKLNYPKEIIQIKEVILERPDQKSHGKFSEIKKLSRIEIIELLKALDNAKPLGLKKIKIDYFICFSTENGNKRIMVTDNQVKGLENDNTFQIERLKFLSNF